MEKALGNGSAIGVYKNACCGYAQGIYEDGNGNTGKYQNRSLPKGFLGRLIQLFTMDVKTGKYRIPRQIEQMPIRISVFGFFKN